MTFTKLVSHIFLSKLDFQEQILLRFLGINSKWQWNAATEIGVTRFQTKLG